MDLLDWFFSFLTAYNFNFSISSEVTLASAFDNFNFGFLNEVTYEQVIRRDDAIVRPHLQSKIQESFKDCG